MRKMKIHFYGFRYYYSAFVLLLIIAAALSLTVLDVYLDYLLPSLFIIFILSSILLGLYEYNRIRYLHTSLVINRKSFYKSSLALGMINAILLLGLFIGYSFLAQRFKGIEIAFINNYLFYLTFLSLNYFGYVIGNTYALLFIRKRFINLLVIVALIALFIFFELTIPIIIDFTDQIINSDVPKIIFIDAGLIILTIVLIIINNFIFKVKP